MSERRSIGVRVSFVLFEGIESVRLLHFQTESITRTPSDDRATSIMLVRE